MQAIAVRILGEGKQVSSKFQDAESTWKAVTNGAMSNYTELD